MDGLCAQRLAQLIKACACRGIPGILVHAAFFHTTVAGLRGASSHRRPEPAIIVSGVEHTITTSQFCRLAALAAILVAAEFPLHSWLSNGKGKAVMGSCQRSLVYLVSLNHHAITIRSGYYGRVDPLAIAAQAVLQANIVPALHKYAVRRANVFMIYLVVGNVRRHLQSSLGCQALSLSRRPGPQVAHSSLPFSHTPLNFTGTIGDRTLAREGLLLPGLIKTALFPTSPTSQIPSTVASYHEALPPTLPNPPGIPNLERTRLPGLPQTL